MGNSRRLLALYKKLLGQFGHQHWWPADSAYEVLVGAILTQNTNWKNVEKAITNLKTAGVLGERKILATPLPQLERLVRPSGFYRQKAERLKLATRKWVEIKRKSRNHKLSIPELHSEFLSVKGIGPETADSIILYALNRPVFVIDAYTRRFCAFHGLCGTRGSRTGGTETGSYEHYRNFFESNLPSDVVLFKEYHALIVEWGKKAKGKPRA